MTTWSKILVITALILLPHKAKCGDDVVRPVLSAFTLEGGTANIVDTYLSPLHFSGPVIGLSAERMQAMKFSPEKWVMRLDGRVRYASASNRPTHLIPLTMADVEGAWSMMYRRNAGPVNIYLGGYTGLNLGGLYAPRNSNNPASAHLSWSIGPTAAAVYSFKLGKIPVVLRDIVRMPISGIFFSPEYDELYYEIYLGNRRGIIHGAWPGNFFRLDNLLSADFRFNSTILRIGYRFDCESTSVNNLVTRNISHSAVVGIACEWLSLGTRPRNPNAKTINAMY